MKEKCLKCNGKGYSLESLEFASGFTYQKLCRNCLGDGKVDWINNIIHRKEEEILCVSLYLENRTKDWLPLSWIKMAPMSSLFICEDDIHIFKDMKTMKHVLTGEIVIRELLAD